MRATEPLLGILLVVLIVIFANSIHNEFAFDDMFAIVRNEDATGETDFSELFVHDFWGASIENELSHKSYRPLTVVSFRLNALFHKWGEGRGWYEQICTSVITSNPLEAPEVPELRTEFYHVVNITLHGITTLLVALFGEWLFELCNIPTILGFMPTWFISSFIFLVHPVHVEAITGMVGRSELLCAIFMMLGLYCYKDLMQLVSLKKSTKKKRNTENEKKQALIHNAKDEKMKKQERQLKLAIEELDKIANIKLKENVPASTKKAPQITGAHTKIILICIRYFLCVLFVLLALLSKEIGFSLPAIFIGFELLWNAQKSKDLFFPWKRQNKVSFFFFNTSIWISLMIAYVFFRKWLVVSLSIVINRQLENPVAFMEPGIFRMLSMAYIHWRYFLLLIFPSQLSCDYSLNCIPMITKLVDIRILCPILFYIVFGGLLVLGVKKYGNGASEKIRKERSQIRKRLPKISAGEQEAELPSPILFGVLFSIGFLTATFLPASNIFLFVGTLIGERLLYIPSIGFSFLFVFAWWFVDQWLRKRHYESLRPVLCLIVIVWLAWMSNTTWERNFEWENEETLFRSAERVCGESAKVQLNLGILERRYENYDAAMHHFDSATRIWPEYCEVEYWSGITLLNKAQYEPAIEILIKALDCNHQTTNSFLALQSLFEALMREYPNAPNLWDRWPAILDRFGANTLSVSKYVESASSYLSISLSADANISPIYAQEVQNNLRAAEKKLNYADANTQCYFYFTKGLYFKSQEHDPLETANIFVNALGCEMTMLSAMKAILEIQKQNPNHGKIHEIWADTIVEMDPNQGYKHYIACAMTTVYKGVANSCLFKLKALCATEPEYCDMEYLAELMHRLSMAN